MTSTDVRIKAHPDPSEPPRPRSSWHARANAVVLAWLALTAVAVAVGGSFGLPRWLLIHLFLLGAVTNAIVTWSEQFATTLGRLPEPGRRRTAARLAALNAGVAAVVLGVVLGRPVVAVCGTATVVGVVAWHTWQLLARARRALPGRFGYVVHWYACAGVALVAGGTLGGLLVSERVPNAWDPRLEAAHAHANLLGWIGLTVIGTLFTLWPTVLRTRIVDGVAGLARWALALAGPGLALAVAALAAGFRWGAVAGLLLYAAAVALTLVPFVRTARRKRPSTAPAWTLAASVCWFAVAVTADLYLVATTPPDGVADAVEPLVPLVLAGFVGQVLLGSLTFLLPVVLGGGPAALKRTAALLEKGWTVRLAAVNAAVPLVALPVPTWLAHTAWAVLLAELAVFVALASTAVLNARGHRIAPSPAVAGTALGSVLTALAVVVAVSGPGLPFGAGAVEANGETRTVDVALGAMTIDPGVVEVEAGTELVLRVTNEDTQQHDLRMGNGAHTPTLGPGESATLEVGVVTASMEGWCTLMGHRAMGMVMNVEVTGSDAVADGAEDDSGHAGHEAHPGTDSAASSDLSGEMGPDWRPYDAELAPAPGGTEHEVEIRASETEQEVAPGVTQAVWTFNGSVPGPVLRGKVGDVFTVTFVNDGTMGHGIDFHAGALAPDEPMRTIQPGERLTYRFRAERAGAWLYHCSTMPMLLHMGNGMYGAVIIDPPDLEPVDHEYVLVQGEVYLGEPGSQEQVDAMRDGEPDAWAFNGTASGYDHAPLTAKAGDRVRVWLVAAGPASGTSFHVVGAQFDTVYKEGAYLLRPDDPGGAQALDLAPAQGGFVETVFPEAGTYPFVDHDFRHGENGAHGVFEIEE
ncbi:multicopper oxidase domain-containing protein [Actinorugispora endophytica]|uniref:Copper-containing nitrite reductase n=1 Tax=Actinorugispora endophytica TaxID=1605990 RepID=A0A4V3D8U0_9ACTN|nr:multicopper oxidase domain-containing protein [Actinorugispora endophytica]TDQ53141.1 nitrite reductase (NO-forming) [Actinorugispora endophytica]